MQDVLYSFEKGVTCMSVHPLNPYYLALGLGDGTVCVMDRRMGGVRNVNGSVTTISPRYLAECSTNQQYKPYFCVAKPFKITCTQFNPTGSELLVSYSEDYVYLFNSSHVTCGVAEAVVSPPLYHSHCYSTRNVGSVTQKASHSACVYKQQEPSEDTSDFVPPMKRLRLRGDWSDTGPEARPNDRQNSNSNSFMTRMSRMFSRWIDQGLSSESPEERNQEDQQAISEPTACTSQGSQNSSGDRCELFAETDYSSASQSSHPGMPTFSSSSVVASLSSTSPLQCELHHEVDESHHMESSTHALSSTDIAVGHLPNVIESQNARSEEHGTAPSLSTATDISSTSHVSSECTNYACLCSCFSILKLVQCLVVLSI